MLVETEFIRVVAHEERRVLVMQRLGVPAPAHNPASIYAEVLAFPLERFVEWGLLIDLRQVDGRSDRRFEAAMRPVRQHAVSNFARVAVLVRSVVGKVQIGRMCRHDGIDTPATTDEAEAMTMAAGSPAQSETA